MSAPLDDGPPRAPAPKVLVIGLDAFDPDLLRAWAEAGELPHLGSLLRECWSAPLANPPGLFVGAVWPTLVTGTCPSRHTGFCHIRPRPGSYRDEFFRGDQVETPALWQLLGDQGRATAALDVPWSPMVRRGPGVQVRAWGAHDSDEFETWPPEWGQDLTARYPPQRQEPCDEAPHTGPGLEELVRELCHRAEQRTAMTEEVLASRSWDLLWMAYSESHCAGHQLWHLHDPEHHAHDAGLLARLGEDPLLTVYKAIDRGVGRLVDAAGPQCRLLVFSSHGIGPMTGAGHLFPLILDRLAGSDPGPATRLFHRARGLWRRLPPGLRAAAGVRGHDVIRARREVYSRDRPGRRFYFVENNNATGAVRVNLQGREPQGIVAPGPEYDALCRKLMADLAALVDDETGKPVARRVFRVDQAFPGPRREMLPDLLVDWDQALPVRAVRSPLLGRVGEEGPVVRTGDHPVEAQGLLLARGPGIPSGEAGPVVPSVDVAPTLAAWVGASLPGVDGRPIPALTGTPPGSIGHAEGAHLPGMELAPTAGGG